MRWENDLEQSAAGLGAEVRGSHRRSRTCGGRVGGWEWSQGRVPCKHSPSLPTGMRRQKTFFFAFLTMARGMFVPRKGIKPKSPALEGGFFTTGPPGKYQKNMFYESWVWAVFLTSKQDSKSKRDSKIGDGDPKPLSEKARQGSSPFKSTKGLSLDTSQKKNITPQDNDTLNSLFIRPK